MAKSSSTHAPAQKAPGGPKPKAAKQPAAAAYASTGFAMSLPSGNPGLAQQRMGQMQRFGGNQAVANGLASGTIHTSFPVGGVDTQQEREAERQAAGLANSMPLRVTATDAGDDRALSEPAREFFESRLGTSLDGVHLHTGRRAAESARALDANAFTVGRDVVFGEGKLEDGSAEGRRILAHELAHVAQQRGRAPLIQRDTPKKKKPKAEGFGPTYQSATSNAAVPYEDYKASIGVDPNVPALKAAHEYQGGTPIDPVAISIEDLKAILNPNSTPLENMDKDVDEHREGFETIISMLKLAGVHITIQDVKKFLIANPKTPEQVLDRKLEKYLDSINVAFETMQIDTAEAQAVYLAHAAGETGGLQTLEETTIQDKSYKGFEGRGPIQVTTEGNYVQTLAYMEKASEEMLASKDDKQKQRGETAKRAVEAIKKDPSAAADPQFTFLFSAAFMQMIGGVRRSATIKADPKFPGTAEEDSWVSGHDHQANYDAAVARLATANEKAKGADPKSEVGKPLVAAQTKAANDVQEWKSTLSRSVVKRETYNRALGILKKKQVKAQTPATPTTPAQTPAPGAKPPDQKVPGAT